jgi:hypothetical protein
MITCKFINDLSYFYDGQTFEENEKCKICYILYRINELGRFPFLEFYFNTNSELEVIHNNNFNNIISFYKNKDNRYSGFYKHDEYLFLFFSTNFSFHKYESLEWWNFNDIIVNKKNFSQKLDNDLTLFFIENKEHFLLQNIITKQLYIIPNVIYNLIILSREQIEYINNYFTIYGLDKHDVILNIVKNNNEHGTLVKHILFSEEITNYKDIISIIIKN